MRRTFRFLPGSRSPRRTAGEFHHVHRKLASRLVVESLEPRLVLNGSYPQDLGPPVAVENNYATEEDTVLNGNVNVIADDTGSGADAPAALGIPLIVTAVPPAIGPVLGVTAEIVGISGGGLV